YFLFFFMTWLPSYLQRTYDLKLVEVGLFTVLPWLAAALVLSALGRASDHLLRTTGRLRIARSYLIAGTRHPHDAAFAPAGAARELDRRHRSVSGAPRDARFCVPVRRCAADAACLEQPRRRAEIPDRRHRESDRRESL